MSLRYKLFGTPADLNEFVDKYRSTTFRIVGEREIMPPDGHATGGFMRYTLSVQAIAPGKSQGDYPSIEVFGTCGILSEIRNAERRFNASIDDVTKTLEGEGVPFKTSLPGALPTLRVSSTVTTRTWTYSL